PAHRRARDPRHRGGGAARGPRARAHGAAGPHPRRGAALPAASAGGHAAGRGAGRAPHPGRARPRVGAGAPGRGPRPGGAVMRPLLRYAVLAVGFVAVLGLLHLRPWERTQPLSRSARESLTVGFLPVTCHLTCPVTDYASRTSRTSRFESERFT